MKKARTIILLIMLSLVGIVATLGTIAGGYILFAQNSETERAQNVPKEHEIIYIDDEKYIAKDTVNYLIVGIDSEGEMKASGYNNTALNDLICLVSFNLTDSTYTIIPISRDTMVDVDLLGLSGKVVGSKYTQIDYAHTFGDGLDMSFRNTCRAASRVLMGVDIERYIGINMTTVPLLNDFLGGVTITLDEDLTELDSTWENGATITLTGKNCLKYLRARMAVGDGTQVSRMHRQQIYMEELVRKARTTDYTFSDILDALNIVNKYVCMDVTYMDMADILKYVKTFHYNGIKQINGYTQKKNGLMEFIPYEEDLKELVISTFYDKAPEEE
ncbi:MAG: LCP family protein [Bacilli bacterium]|nr:LCP family protein [Bacilli bacterium]